MRHTNSTPSSFRDCQPNEIELVSAVGELKPVNGPSNTHKLGQETWSCAWSEDSSYFAWSCGDKFVRLVPWDKQYGRLSKKARQYSGCSTSDVDGIRVLLDDQDEEPESDHRKEQRPIYLIDCKDYVWSVAFGSSHSQQKDNNHSWKRVKINKSTILATGLQTGRIKLWDCSTGNLLLELLDHKDVVREISFAPDGSLIMASAARDGTVKLWDLTDDGNMYQTLRTGAKWNNCCRWSHNGKYLACVGSNKVAVIWNMDNTYRPRVLKGHYHDILACDFSPDSAMFATACYDTRVIVWDPYTGDVLLELGHLYPPPRPIFAGGANEHYVRGVSFSRNGLQLCSVADDGYLRVWNLEDPCDPQYIAEHQNALCCAFAPQDQRISVGDRMGGVIFYAVPRCVPGLQQLCRMTVRKKIISKEVDLLCLPVRLKEYLKYHDLEC
ncbi:WD repeat and SOCS box-containing protein 1-like isoform X2 [Ostrea edulis]|uniref:WD repeat and SOCS box-containing protein 1-like isoform X2 n=1 Tax=Ostrea edulis TaxID=37623 RepID=UPI0024AFE05A|nr:WD repeat and SOCS box-containing protein 1-like isoform X2 [Ostrea edulis]